jgi:hypothetical protein
MGGACGMGPQYEHVVSIIGMGPQYEYFVSSKSQAKRANKYGSGVRKTQDYKKQEQAIHMPLLWGPGTRGLGCVACTSTARDEKVVGNCPSSCSTKKAVDVRMNELKQAKAKAKPMLSIVRKTFRNATVRSTNVEDDEQRSVAEETKNRCPQGSYGCCLKCMRAADVSTYKVDSRDRIVCRQPDCKMTNCITKWFCVKCSNIASAGRNMSSKVEFANCVCYAKLLLARGQIVLSCPQASCRGWKAYDSVSFSSNLRIFCPRCSCRRIWTEWNCFVCNMKVPNCICKEEKVRNPKVNKRPAKQNKPSAIRKRTHKSSS